VYVCVCVVCVLCVCVWLCVCMNDEFNISADIQVMNVGALLLNVAS